MIVNLWQQYSKKLAARIEHPLFAGVFTREEANQRHLLYIEGIEGFVEEGNAVQFYWLVRETDGVIEDARFQAFGHSTLIAAADVAAELSIGKNYDQAKRLSAEVIDRHLRDRTDVPAFPKETLGHLNLTLEALDNAALRCADLPLPHDYVTPLPEQTVASGAPYPGWESLTTSQKIAVITEVVQREVQPYVEMDAGGVEVLDLLHDREVIIGYRGSCSSCPSSFGSTLNAILQILRLHVHPDLVVVPDLSTLSLPPEELSH